MIINSERGLHCAICHRTISAPITVLQASRHADIHGERLSKCFPDACLICDHDSCRKATPWVGFFKRGWKVKLVGHETYEWCPKHCPHN